MEITITQTENTGFMAKVVLPGVTTYTTKSEHENLNYALAELLSELRGLFQQSGWCEKCKGFFSNTDIDESWSNAGLCPSCYEAMGF
jgi:hypothetical protein